MGGFFFTEGPPWELILFLRDRYGVDTFVETGTLYGDTAYQASLYFPHVITIEASEIHYRKAVERYGKEKKIRFLLGDSRKVLKTLLPTLRRPCVFWLDSHFCGGESYGKEDECPLGEELTVLKSLSFVPHYLFIDDARLFLAPPPPPHNPKAWLTFPEVLSHLGNGFYLVVFKDVICAVPETIREEFLSKVQEEVGKIWVSYGKDQEISLSSGFKKMFSGLKVMAKATFLPLFQKNPVGKKVRT